MKLQASIDRVTMEMAVEIAEKTRGCAEIIEVGTSLVKEYGLEGSVKVIREKYPKQCILADIKTCDEGAYEFRKTYEAGADIPTVLGISDLSTLKECQQVAAEFQKEYMIDLRAVTDEKLEVLKKEFPEAIFRIQLPYDCQETELEALIEDSCKKLEGIEKVAVAGGVKLGNIALLNRYNVDIVIVGGAISRVSDAEEAARAFANEISRMKWL